MIRSRSVVRFPDSLRKLKMTQAKNFAKAIKDHITLRSEPQVKAVLREMDSRSNLSETTNLADFVPKVTSAGLRAACYHVCVVGSECVGKSTVLADFIEDCIYDEAASPILDGEEIVFIVLPMDKMDTRTCVKVSEFIFGPISKDVTISDVNKAMQWMSQNPHRLYFVMDDIDMIACKLSQSFCFSVGDYACPKNILNGILSGMLFPGCTVVSSCKEQNLDTIKEINGIVIEKSVAVQGLGQSAVQELTKAYLGYKLYHRAFEAMKTARPYAAALCENPTILLYTVLGLRVDEDNPPCGMAGIFLRLLNEMYLEQSMVIDVIEGLKITCYRAKKTGRVRFDDSHMRDAGLELSDTRRLRLKSHSFIKEFTRNERVWFEFCHPIFLDGFMALYIYELGREKCKIECQEISEDTRYTKSWQMLNGYVTDEENLKLILQLTPADYKKRTRLANDHKFKKQLFMKCNRTVFKSMQEDAADVTDQLSALHLVAECGASATEVVVEEFESFELISYGSDGLNQSDSSALAACICFKGNLERLQLTDCLLPSTFIFTLHEHITLYKRKAKTLQVQIENGDIMSAQSTWIDVVEKEITERGGEISLNNCGLRFPKGSLSEKKMVSLEMRNFSPYNPVEYIPITPSMHVSIEDDLRKIVTVNLTPWCCEEDEDEALTVEIFRLPDDSETWVPLTSLALTENMKFECKAFSTVRAFLKQIKRRLKSGTYFRMTGIILSKNNVWCANFMLNHKSTKKEAEEETKKFNYEAVNFPFNTIYTRIGSSIKVDISVVEPAGVTFNGLKTISPTFKLTKRFLKNESYQLTNTFLLTSQRQSNCACTVTMRYQVFLDDKQTSNNEGIFQREVTFQGSNASCKGERIENVFDDEILPRFADAAEYFKFARSSKGFCIDTHQQTTIQEDYYQNKSEQKQKMFQHWIGREGSKATPERLRRLVDRYFNAKPLANATERQLLKREVSEVTARYPGYKEWISFSTSPNGLHLPKQDIDKVIQGQANVTPDHKHAIIQKWVDYTGEEACADKLREVADNFDRSRRQH